MAVSSLLANGVSVDRCLPWRVCPRSRYNTARMLMRILGDNCPCNWERGFRINEVSACVGGEENKPCEQNSAGRGREECPTGVARSHRRLTVTMD